MDEPHVEIPCIIHTGDPGGCFSLFVPDPNHPPAHNFTPEQVCKLLWALSADDWEDGPRCLLDVLAAEEEETE